MIETVQANDVIDEQEFGYYARMEGYANLSLDMKKLCAIRKSTFKKAGCKYMRLYAIAMHDKIYIGGLE